MILPPWLYSVRMPSGPMRVLGSPNTAYLIGTAQAGSANTLTLVASAHTSLPAYAMPRLRLKTGPGSVQERPVSAYNGGTKVATVSPRWRTNLLLRSEAIDLLPWGNINTPVLTPNSSVAPDGTLSADTVEDDSVTVHEGRSQAASVGANTSIFCGSIHVLKDAITTPRPGIHLVIGANRYQINVNTQTGEVSNYVGLAPVAFGSVNEGNYWRIWVAGANDGTGPNATLEFYPALTDAAGAELVSLTRSAVCWGMQIEQVSAIGDYIKTEAAAITLPDATTGYEVVGS